MNSPATPKIARQLCNEIYFVKVPCKRLIRKEKNRGCSPGDAPIFRRLKQREEVLVTQSFGVRAMRRSSGD